MVDVTGKKNGRGAYVCDQPACWDKLLRDRGILNQALKAQVNDEELAALAAWAAQTVHNLLAVTDGPE